MPRSNCKECGGSGVVPTDELDRDSMQYMRGVGTAPCLCVSDKQKHNEDDMDDDSDLAGV